MDQRVQTSHRSQASADTGGRSSLVTEKVWDLPTRLFKWALVIAVGTAWYLGEFRSFTTIEWHFIAGYTVGGLLVFRILWGLIGLGAPSSRLGALFFWPGTVFGYLGDMARREPSGWRGHTPVGAIGVITLILVLGATVITGLFSEDDGLFAQGPLASMVDASTRLTLISLHHLLTKLVLVVVAIHVCAVLFYAIWKREDLVRPMITGWKKVWPKKD
ncbi:MAG: cytochrome b/b6 domain-containing protein [Neomegalonema sp.]|nr:cytochrome b/b6 domain-containing protein [Neomegalonema sp.]